MTCTGQLVLLEAG